MQPAVGTDVRKPVETVTSAAMFAPIGPYSHPTKADALMTMNLTARSARQRTPR